MAKKLLLLVLIFASLTLADWTVEEVDHNGGPIRGFNDIAYDSNDDVILCHSDS